jgi:hypothetical protein
VKKRMYSLYDAKTEVYNRPFACINDADAIRSFSRLLTDRDTMPGQFREDFSLFHIGFFDDAEGCMGADGPPRIIITGVALWERLTKKGSDE